MPYHMYSYGLRIFKSDRDRVSRFCENNRIDYFQEWDEPSQFLFRSDEDRKQVIEFMRKPVELNVQSFEEWKKSQ